MEKLPKRARSIFRLCSSERYVGRIVLIEIFRSARGQPLGEITCTEHVLQRRSTIGNRARVCRSQVRKNPAKVKRAVFQQLAPISSGIQELVPRFEKLTKALRETR